jgi:DNA-binding transcriptional LysR family regulator
MQLSLRQIETIRAVMITGTVLGASRQLNISQPVVSRTMKHIEDVLGMSLFVRKVGRFVPAETARDVFLQVQEISQKLDDLGGVLSRMKSGEGATLRIASVMSVASGPLPHAISRLRKRFPELKVRVDSINHEQASDYLVLGKGELAFISGKPSNALVKCDLLADGELFCLVSSEHPLAANERVSIEEIARWPMVGLHPRERLIDTVFDVESCSLVVSTRDSAVVRALVRNMTGIAIIHPFGLSDISMDGIKILRLREKTKFPTYVAYRKDRTPSEFSKHLIISMRANVL